jgi:hypothetical protein
MTTPDKRASKNLVLGAILVAIFAVGAFFAVRTFGTNGQEAIARMTVEERVMLSRLQSIRRGMSYAEVVEVVGEPDESGPLGMRPKWLIGGNPLNGVVVYILPTGAHKFTWISIGRFTYNEELGTGAARAHRT